ncbi:hypothetical protein ACTGXZ_06905 [Streptococcus suis]
MQIKVTLLDQWQYGQPQKIKTLQSLSLADCGKARGKTANKERKTC